MAKGWTKLSDEKAKQLIELVRQGHHRETACAAVRIARQTLHNWLKAGRDGDERWAEFAREFDAAEATFEIAWVGRIVELGQNDWRALFTLLERRAPLRWGQAKADQAKLEAERQAMMDAIVAALEKRGMADAAEEVVRELAGSSEAEASRTRRTAQPAH